jgi:protein-S-isoprenylcysteine O-methyltransferase Ste14
VTPQEKRAWYGLVIGILWTLSMVAVFVMRGVTAFDEDVGMRVIVYILFAAGILAYVAMMYITGWRMSRDGVIQDERDKLILRRVPVYQMFAVLFTLAIWMVALTETYDEEGQIPIVFPYLIFESAIVVNIVFASAGTLIAYWRARQHG